MMSDRVSRLQKKPVNLLLKVAPNRKCKYFTAIIKLLPIIIKMASLILANTAYATTPTASVASSQNYYNNKFSARELRPANYYPSVSASKHLPSGQIHSSTSDSSSELGTFEWLRLTNSQDYHHRPGSNLNKSKRRNDSSILAYETAGLDRDQEAAAAAAANSLYEIERIHTPHNVGKQYNYLGDINRNGSSSSRSISSITKLRQSSADIERRFSAAVATNKTTRHVQMFDDRPGMELMNVNAIGASVAVPSQLGLNRHPIHGLAANHSSWSTTTTRPVLTNKSSRSIHQIPAGRYYAINGGNSQLLGAPFQQVDTAESTRIEHNPDCALILKRTYILKPSASSSGDSSGGGKSDTDEWGEKFVFNDIDTDDLASDHEPAPNKKRRIQKSDLCIKQSDVDRALEEAKHRIKFTKLGDLDSGEVGERSLASIGELNLATGLLLTKRFDLSHDEIMNALPMIDMSASKLYWNDLCPKHVRPMVCTKTRYRTITGHCNNLKHPSWGASKTPYSRYLPPDYADGLSAPRASRSGAPLPSARLITSIVHQDADEPSHDYSILFADWGQLLNHDITRVAVGDAPDCCPQHLKGLCMPIPVPPNDPLYSKFNVKCLKFERSLAAIRPKCLLGHRAQINLITSSLDASFVYGSTKQQAQRLRAFSEGKMKVLNYFDNELKLKPLLPPKTDQPDKDCLARPKNLFCFDAGDVRVNEQTHLTVLHTIYIREHNRVAKQLAAMNMEWDDDKIYHEARHIVAACVQHVTVNEFLPLLLGSHHVSEYKIKPMAGSAKDVGGYWPGYDPSVTISTGTGFAAAAFRYGHSMIEGIIRRLDPKSGALIKSELLRFLFKRPFWLYEPGAVDQLIAGMLATPAEQTDPHMSEELSGHLFQPPAAKFGHDLAAINIQRGRDQGVPGYNEWREWCGLKRAKSFSDLEPLLMNHTAWQYSRIYKHVDDIDLWSAGISERKLPGSAVGPTMACIIARQFLNYKRGDRFWYENPNQPSSFTPNQLKEIKKITLAKILCMNADDLPRIQPWAMRLPHPIYNAKVPCESLPTFNLKYWDSSLMDNFD